jgi:hypothetical protein
MPQKTLTTIEKAANNAISMLAVAADKATSAISSAALDATRLLASQASDAAKITSAKGADDHDTLISFRAETIQELKGIRDDIAKLNDSTGKQLLDHEARLRRLEIWGFTALGVLLALQFYFNYLRK